jgi:TniQ
MMASINQLSQPFPDRPGYAFTPEFYQVAYNFKITVELLASEVDLPITLARCKYDRLSVLNTIEITRIGQLFDTNEEIIQERTFEYFAKRMISKTAQTNNAEKVRQRLARLLNPYPQRLKICPMCMKEHQRIRLAWQTTWAFACLRHKTMLIDSCPACHKPIASQRKTSEIEVTRGTCQNRSGQEIDCSQQLNLLPVFSLEHYPQILRAQHRLEVALQGKPCQLLKKTVQPTAYLHAIHQMLEVLWMVLLPEHLENVPDQVMLEFQNFTVVRERYFGRHENASDETQPIPLISRRWGRVHLMVLAMPMATQLTDLHSQKAVSEALNAMIQRTCFFRPEYARWLVDYFERMLTDSSFFWHAALRESVHWARRKYHVYEE